MQSRHFLACALVAASAWCWSSPGLAQGAAVAPTEVLARGPAGEVTVADVQADREGSAVRLAEKYRCVVVLKGSGTLIADSDGALWHNATGNAGLARGGSGDILAGLAAGLLAAGSKQGRTPADAAGKTPRRT